MKIKVLGCHGGELPRHRTTCFLIDRKLTIDGGAITAALELDEILAIDDIFLTHSHFDHVKDVPLMTDLLAGKREKPVVVHGPAETMEAMDKDVFNNRMWPAFRTTPAPENPAIPFAPLPLHAAYLYHLKPSVIDELKAEIKALRKDYLHVCELDEVYNIR